MIFVFPSTISHKKAKIYLEQLCQKQHKEYPYYELILDPNPNMKTVAIKIGGYGVYQFETDKKPQQFIAQKMYQEITGASAPKKKAKEFLEKICKEKDYGAPIYQTIPKKLRVRVSVEGLTAEASHLSQDYAEKLAAREMYKLLRNLSKTK